jgi:hypothetical protein
MHRGSGCGQRIAAWAARFALLLPAAAAAAGPPASAIPIYAAHASAASFDSLLDEDCASINCDRRLSQHRLDFGPAPSLGATLVEIRSYALPGQPSRPHHAIGLRSHGLESALNDVGIGARHCLAPVVRLHTRVSSSFDISGTLWVYLRCSLE